MSQFFDQCPRKAFKQQKLGLLAFLGFGITEICRRNGSPVDPANLSEIDWAAVASTDFRDAKAEEGKQAEFLLFESFPWTLIEKLGHLNGTIATTITLLEVHKLMYYRQEAGKAGWLS